MVFKLLSLNILLWTAYEKNIMEETVRGEEQGDRVGHFHGGKKPQLHTDMCLAKWTRGPGVIWAFLVAQRERIRLPVQETWVWFLDWEAPWRRKWQPTPVFLPVKSHGQRSLVGYSPWGLKKVRPDWATKTTNQRVLYQLTISKNGT